MARKDAYTNLRAKMEGLVEALRRAANERDKAAREFAKRGMTNCQRQAEGEALAYGMAATWLEALLREEAQESVKALAG